MTVCCMNIYEWKIYDGLVVVMGTVNLTNILVGYLYVCAMMSCVHTTTTKLKLCVKR